MSNDLTPAQWHEIVRQSIYLADVNLGRFIGLVELRKILQKSRRSTDQNALLYALYRQALERGGEMLAGFTAEELHEWCLGEYFGWDRQELFGRKRLRPKRRSSRLTKIEFAELVDWFVRKMAEHSIVLQLPGEEHGEDTERRRA